ncbi:MAG: nucleotidyltransferase domain-containing protein [Chloroflexota bacterium]
MKTLPEGLLEKIAQQLVVELQPEQIILFGSHAWGSPNEDSDLDLLIIVSHSGLKPTERATQAYRALRGLFVPIDILVKTRAEVERFRRVPASLECEILEKGKVLYGRSETAVSAELVDQGTT